MLQSCREKRWYCAKHYVNIFKLGPSYLSSVLTTFMPTQKHSYAPAKNVEFCSLLLDKVTALLAKRLARITSFLFFLLLSTILACVAFLHCHELNEFLVICVLLLICHHIAVNLVVENMVASASTRYLYSSVDIYLGRKLVILGLQDQVWTVTVANH